MDFQPVSIAIGGTLTAAELRKARFLELRNRIVQSGSPLLDADALEHQMDDLRRRNMSRAKEYRSRKRDRLSKLTVEATGETFIVRRVAIDAWIMAGKMPETLAREVLSAWHQMGTGAAVENMSVDQLMSNFQMVRDLVVAACVSPKLVTGDQEADPERDEIHFAELEVEERTALIAYCMNGAGATPIEATNGNLTVEAVATFPESGERSVPVPVSQNG